MTRARPLFFGFILALSATAAPALARDARAADVLVFAASSVTNAIQDINALYGKTGHGKTGRGTAAAAFGSSGMLARQIENGAPAHILISANYDWINYLSRRLLIHPQDMRTLMTNSLVLIAPADSTIKLTAKHGFPLLEKLRGGRLAIADPAHTPAGAYAKAALTALGVWDTVARRTARGHNVREALALVERGGAPLGIVYATDAKISRNVRIVAPIPAKYHAPIRYAAALIAGRKTSAALRYFAFLASDEAKAVFRKHGFVVAEAG